MNRRKTRKKFVAEINITPFTDVILVLLVIFMITTPLLSQSALKVKLPKASAAQGLESKIQQVYITVSAEGPVYFENTLVTNKELKEKMSSVYNNNPSIAVILNIDRTVQFKNVVKVLDILTELGVKNLNIAATNE